MVAVDAGGVDADLGDDAFEIGVHGAQVEAVVMHGAARCGLEVHGFGAIPVGAGLGDEEDLRPAALCDAHANLEKAVAVAVDPCQR